MTKLLDYDLAKESVAVQEFAEDIKAIINNGNYEPSVTNSSQPDFTAPSNQSVFVLSIFGAQYRLYVSYQSSWYYTTLTKI